MTAAELHRLKARVHPTICNTYRQDEHDGSVEERIEGRISADDFMRMCAAIERLQRALRGGNADKDNAELFEWLADRLVHVHGESENVDYIHACRERAAMIRTALQQEV